MSKLSENARENTATISIFPKGMFAGAKGAKKVASFRTLPLPGTATVPETREDTIAYLRRNARTTFLINQGKTFDENQSVQLKSSYKGNDLADTLIVHFGYPDDRSSVNHGVQDDMIAHVAAHEAMQDANRLNGSLNGVN